MKVKMNDIDKANLPESVVKQMEDAEQTRADMDARRTEKAAEVVPAAPESVASPAPAGPSAPEPAAVVVSASAPTNPTVAPSNAPQAAPITETLEQQVARLTQEKAKAQQKFDTWYGSHGGDVQQLKSQIFDLQRQIESARGEAPAAATAVATAETGVVVGGGSDSAAAAAPATEAGEAPSYMKYMDEDAVDRF